MSNCGRIFGVFFIWILFIQYTLYLREHLLIIASVAVASADIVLVSHVVIIFLFYVLCVLKHLQHVHNFIGCSEDALPVKKICQVNKKWFGERMVRD
jgi:hypothetical protein